ncbi:MAG: FG-GAP repeat domain-containing protein, partial [Limisphaerales bacterium]
MKTISTLLAAGILLAAVASGSAQTSFTKITTGAIVNDLGSYTRCSWGDFNNDGFLDLFVSNYEGRTNVFYRNNGNGTFTKITLGDPVQDADYHTGAAAADYDNDGHLDLLVSAGVGAPTARRNLLYHNNGDRTFSRVSGGSVTNQLGFFNACSWADYDNDGFLDLFVTDSGASSGTGGTNLLFHNNGDGTFAKVISGTVPSGVGNGDGGLWADYDSDGFMDLIVVNYINP